MIKPKTLTTIVASAILAIAPLINGCQSQKVPVYGSADPNGNHKVIGYYNSRHFSTGLNIDTYNSQKRQVYDTNSP